MPKQSMAPAPDPARILEVACLAAADAVRLRSLPLHPRERTWIRLDGPADTETWLIGWPPGTGTGWHDHGGSVGAFVVADGTLREYTPPVPVIVRDDKHLEIPFQAGTETQVRLPAGSARSFPYDHVHDVRNVSATEHAVSIHVYAPELTLMRLYEQTPDRLVYHSTQRAQDW